MNNYSFRKYLTVLVIALVILLQSCGQPEGDSPGSEYMPDMGHSIAYESNHYDYYYYNTWGTEDEYHQYAQPRKPVKGTVARGYAGLASAPSAAGQKKVLANLNGESSIQSIKVPKNGNVPYPYANTEEERSRAAGDIIENPFPITEDGLARGKELYNVFCGICHGEKGDGNGYLVAEENPNVKYPAQPANFLLDTFLNSTNGRYYHAIVYGKNVMGGYTDKISYEERWQVIHWIHALQAKDKKLVYTENKNTLNKVDIPGKKWREMAMANEPAMPEGTTDHNHDSHDGDADTDGAHSHDGDHHGGSGSHDGHDHGVDDHHDHEETHK